jgi:hypothetical protein
MLFKSFVKIFFVTLFRLCKYKEEWRKHIREIKIKSQQRKAIRFFNPKVKKLIVFFIPGANYFTGKENISGGLLSIISLCTETDKLFSSSRTHTICSTFYDEHLIFSLTSFENEVGVLNTKLIERYFREVEEVTLHIPEFFVENFVVNQLQNRWLGKSTSVHINILNQNIVLMPNCHIISNLKERFPISTVTTSHTKYCNPFYRNTYDLPLHLFSAYLSPEFYTKVDFFKKERLVLFSPDNEQLNIQLIDYLSENLPNYKFQIIRDLKYEDYKDLIAKAMFIITLGEGLDGYFIESYFSGSVAFAIKNLFFFDEKYLTLPCLFTENNNLNNELIKLIEYYSDKQEYYNLNEIVVDLLSEDFCYVNYQNNLLKFYNKEYTYA